MQPLTARSDTNKRRKTLLLLLLQLTFPITSEQTNSTANVPAARIGKEKKCHRLRRGPFVDLHHSKHQTQPGNRACKDGTETHRNEEGSEQRKAQNSNSKTIAGSDRLYTGNGAAVKRSSRSRFLCFDELFQPIFQSKHLFGRTRASGSLK